MFDDDESTVDGDVSSSLRVESDVYIESEVVTPDPEEDSLSDTDQVKEDSSFHNLESLLDFYPIATESIATTLILLQ
jgi:hypothetical protein